MRQYLDITSFRLPQQCRTLRALVQWDLPHILCVLWDATYVFLYIYNTVFIFSGFNASWDRLKNLFGPQLKGTLTWCKHVAMLVGYLKDILYFFCQHRLHLKTRVITVYTTCCNIHELRILLAEPFMSIMCFLQKSVINSLNSINLLLLQGRNWNCKYI